MFVPPGESGGRRAPVTWRHSRSVGLLAALAIALAMVFSYGVGAKPVAAYADGYVNTDVLNLRTDAGTWAEVIGQMWDGEYVGVLSGPTEDGWYNVDYQGSVGWAFGSYLMVNGSAGGGGGSDSSSSFGGERWVDVNRSTRMVTLYEGNSAIDSYYASFGWDESSHGFYSSAIGTYYVYSKNAGLAWTDWGKVYIKYWVGYDAERYNGFHSYSLDANGNELPNGDGATGGCVALPLWAAESVYGFVTIGSRIEVHW